MHGLIVAVHVVPMSTNKPCKCGSGEAVSQRTWSMRLKMATIVVSAVLKTTFGILSITRYVKITRQRFAIDDTNVLVR